MNEPAESEPKRIVPTALLRRVLAVVLLMTAGIVAFAWVGGGEEIDEVAASTSRARPVEVMVSPESEAHTGERPNTTVDSDSDNDFLSDGAACDHGEHFDDGPAEIEQPPVDAEHVDDEHLEDALFEDALFEDALFEDADRYVDDDEAFENDGSFDDEFFDGDEFFDEDALHEDEDEDAVASFRVDGDAIEVGSASGDSAREAEVIWSRFVELIPADQRQMIVRFELLSDEFGGAYVYATDGDPSRWVLGVGPGLGEELDEILVHEFGHLVTLRAEEVPPGDDPTDCSTYFTGEGCALDGSTFAAFVAKFWPQSMIDEIDTINDTGDWDELDAFYERYQDRFVTEYAATNPGEDLAETFAAFVLGERPTGSTIADQKLNFLWADPEMVALRAEIRST